MKLLSVIPHALWDQQVELSSLLIIHILGMIVPPLLKNVDVISVFYFPSFSSHLLFSQSLLLNDDLNTWFTIFCLPPVPELFLVIFHILV